MDDAELIARGRKLVEDATPERLDYLAIHNCGAAGVAIAALEALGAAFRRIDELEGRS